MVVWCLSILAVSRVGCGSVVYSLRNAISMTLLLVPFFLPSSASFPAPVTPASLDGDDRRGNHFVSREVMTKANGQHAARKLVRLRRKNRWADKGWKKAHTFVAQKANPFGGSSHAKGI
ncbi:putative 40S ribosomal protein S23, partial [Trypanosoma conorhini]